VAAEELADVGDAADVGGSVLGREAEVFGEVFSDFIPIEYYWTPSKGS